jgi:hypothetical protein
MAVDADDESMAQTGQYSCGPDQKNIWVFSARRIIDDKKFQMDPAWSVEA